MLSGIFLETQTLTCCSFKLFFKNHYSQFLCYNVMGSNGRAVIKIDFPSSQNRFLQQVNVCPCWGWKSSCQSPKQTGWIEIWLAPTTERSCESRLGTLDHPPPISCEGPKSSGCHKNWPRKETAQEVNSSSCWGCFKLLLLLVLKKEKSTRKYDANVITNCFWLLCKELFLIIKPIEEHIHILLPSVHECE